MHLPLQPRASRLQPYVSQVRALQRSEDEAASFCSGINQTEAHRCRRAAHLRDWGPDPHWVALVELLLASSASEAVVGAGYPFFKARTTLAQLAPTRPRAPPHAPTRPRAPPHAPTCPHNSYTPS